MQCRKYFPSLWKSSHMHTCMSMWFQSTLLQSLPNDLLFPSLVPSNASLMVLYEWFFKKYHFKHVTSPLKIFHWYPTASRIKAQQLHRFIGSSSAEGARPGSLLGTHLWPLSPNRPHWDTFGFWDIWQCLAAMTSVTLIHAVHSVWNRQVTLTFLFACSSFS